jgi:hypothetical protein
MSKKAPNYVIGLVPYISILLPFGIAAFYVRLLVECCECAPVSYVLD